MLGISEHAGEQFRKWIYEFFELGAADSTIVQDVIAEIMAFFDGEIAKRRASPGDDLISYLLDARIDGKPIDQIDINGALRLLLFAGIDTTWSAIGACLLHLATHADDRKRLVDDPQLIPPRLKLSCALFPGDRGA
jgi:cytochrome P450